MYRKRLVYHGISAMVGLVMLAIVLRVFLLMLE